MIKGGKHLTIKFQNNLLATNERRRYRNIVYKCILYLYPCISRGGKNSHINTPFRLVIRRVLDVIQEKRFAG